MLLEASTKLNVIYEHAIAIFLQQYILFIAVKIKKNCNKNKFEV